MKTLLITLLMVTSLLSAGPQAHSGQSVTAACSVGAVYDRAHSIIDDESNCWSVRGQERAYSAGTKIPSIHRD